MTAPIEVLELRRLTGDGSLRAFVKIQIGALVVHGVRVVQQPGQRPWVALPQVPGRAKADGSGAGWYPVVEIVSKTLMARVRDAVIEAWEAGS